ncbi:ABC transporter ATP-binding protein [Nonomuraea rubra]|uniref:ABC transporter ATP-binding protein n=1 Tax=Nonomuraea rubra TaxID=46180 RepID=UPI0033EFEE79
MVNRTLLGLIRPGRGRLAIAVLAGVLVSATYAGQSLLLTAAVAQGLRGELTAAILACCAALALVAVRAVLVWGREVAAARGAEEVKAALRDRLYRHLLTLGPGYVAEVRTGGVLTTLVDSVEAIDRYVGVFLPQVLISVLGGVGIVAVLAWIDPAVAVLVAVTAVLAAAARLLRILDAVPDVTEQATGPAGRIEPEVTFDHVTFRYGDGLPEAVRDVSFSVPAGTTVALAGHSGAGKSTCASLLLRHWDTSAGTVRIGGHDLRDLPFDQLRSTVVAVPQDTYLFAMSIRDNLRLARPDATDATDAEVEQAARTACAHDFIAALPDGYDTLVGERGAHLSGGQRQRLAIARALLTHAPVLVLDEAVSNLDAESEAAIDQALRSARGEHTTLVVAHRPSTLRAADTVVLLDAGRVVDIGHHHDLLSRSAEYRRLLAR